jgi:hypothetical protein
LSRILGIDPGLATGLSVYDTDTLSIVETTETGNGIYGFQPQFKWLMGGMVSPLGVTHMVCEKFTLRSSNEFVADLSGVEIIGWLKGQSFWGKNNPEPVQHMTLTKLRKNKDKYPDSPVTKLMKRDGHKIGKGHTRMASSTAIWYAAMVLKHEPTLRMLSGKAPI